ncbi:hypothetical protein K4L06_09795 [Lysobacter sp. BMK333-48F3]|uniref:hypothetical protein n=1 Tax=Lysobacter sp. BMK333-48F3 TaxID=2867962 RepID=UPI001C8BE0B5|nr:hypothetical protein [Lysobacter sp. BMK333-48F3]MBX9401605.1 hypothetical protein [Lysobacter sp. BMK333-48F3]
MASVRSIAFAHRYRRAADPLRRRWRTMWLAAFVALCGPAAATVVLPEFPSDQDYAGCPGGQAWYDASAARADRARVRRETRAAPRDAVLRAALLQWSGGASAAELMSQASMADYNESLRKAFAHPDTDEVRAERAQAQAKAAQMREFLQRDPLPGLDEVGEDGLEVLWYGITAIGDDAAFQREAGERFLRAEIASPGAPAYYLRGVAERIDQALIDDGRPQRYGTAHDHPEGKRVVRAASDDEAAMEARRARLGLMPAALETCLRQRLNNPYGWLPDL